MGDKNQELEDLEALLASPGWALFRSMAEREWGPVAYRLKAQQILGALDLKSAGDAASLILQLECGAREVERMFVLPVERIKRLRMKESR